MIIKNIIMCLLVLSLFVTPVVIAEEADGAKDPSDMTKSVRVFLTDWFDQIVLLVCVVVAILYLCGVVSARMVAKGIGAAGIVIGSIFIFHALPWIATNLF